MRVANFNTRPVTPKRWQDLEAIFNSKGCSMARGCWCMYYRKSGRQPAPPTGSTISDVNRAGLRALVESGTPPGLIGYQDKVPVGWISMGPREDFAKLRRSPVMKAVDDQSVWSIVCFVVAKEHRGKGVASALLNGAIGYAQSQGVTILEAYPVDKSKRSRDDSMFFGPKSMYDAAGFTEVARRRPTRPIVRLTISNQRRGA